MMNKSDACWKKPESCGELASEWSVVHWVIQWSGVHSSANNVTKCVSREISANSVTECASREISANNVTKCVSR